MKSLDQIEARIPISLAPLPSATVPQVRARPKPLISNTPCREKEMKKEECGMKKT